MTPSKPKEFVMNFDELKQTLSEFKNEIEKGLTSTEQYTTFKENLEKLRASAKRNPFFATLSEVIIHPISKELDRAYKKFSEKDQVDTYEGFDLLRDPKVVDKVQAYLETLESSYANMDADKFAVALEPLLKVVSDLNNINPENSKEEEFADNVRRRVFELKLAANRAHTPVQAASKSGVFLYHQTPFDITEKGFSALYRTYMEDLAVNAAAKNVQQLLEAGKILQIINDDMKNTKPTSNDDVKFLQEVVIQTPLLLKIVDRQIALKSSALAHYNAQQNQKQSKISTTRQKPAKATTVRKPATKSVAKKATKKTAKKATKTVSKTKKGVK